MESFARISTLLETARDLTIEAAQSASTGVRRKDVVLATPGSFRETKKLLNSRMEREVLEGLRRVTAMMARGHDCSTFFADVVINVASPTIEIKKLVYLYLLRYAESEPDLALLSINTIQKALNDQNQLVRALAIRVMSGIRVPVISQIVALGIKKCASDMSAYVRKSAALAIPKCYRLDPGTLPLLKEYLGNLLGDKSYYVVGAAVMAFLEVCPEDLELVHPHYQSLVRMLIDMDEWGQLALLKLLTVYARRCFPVKTTAVKKIKEKEKKDSEAFYSDEEGDEKEDMEMVRVMDPDLQMFLTACLPLLQSRNSAVILAVARAYRHLAPSEELSKISGHLVSLLRATVDIKHIALINIVSIALEHPQIFSPYVSNFLIHRLDPPHIYRLKLEVLTLLFPHSDKHIKNLILNELEFYAQDYDKDLVRACVRAIGRCAQNERQNSTRCLRLLLRQIESPDGTLVAESLTVIRHIIQMNPSGHVPTVIKLAKALNTASNPIARASIIWLVGEFAGVNGGDNIAADTLRILAKGFHDEAEATKHQIVLLAAKVYAHYLDRIGASRQHSSEDDDDEEEDTHPIPLLFKYITLLARYDVSYDLRDRTRMYKSLLSVPSSTQLATLLLLAPKPVPHAPSPCEGIQKFTVGSAAMVLRAEGELDAAGLRGYEPLPEWVAEGQEPDRGVSGALGGRAKDTVEGSAAERIEKKVKEVEERAPKKSPPREETLDEWLEGSDDEEDDEEDEESEEETDDEEDDDDEEEEETDEEESEEESDEDTSDEKTGMIAGRSK